MKKLLEIMDLHIETNNERLLSIDSLDFYENVNVFLCGTNASGKTMLLKAIAKQIKYRGKMNRKGKIAVVFDKSFFYTNTVEDELKLVTLEEEEKEIVFTFLSKKIMNKNPNEVSMEEKKLILFCQAFLTSPDLLFVDEVFFYLSEKSKKKVFTYIKKKNITLVTISKNIEDALDYDYMMVLDQGAIAIEGKTMQVLQEEKILKRLGIGLPFYVDLSIQLKLYGLLDSIYLSKESMVDALWK